MQYQTNENFIKGIKFAQSFAAKKDPRYMLNGVLCEIRKDSITTVGTDGHRLGYTVLNANDEHMVENDGVVALIIPNDIVATIVKTMMPTKTQCLDIAIDVAVNGRDFAIDSGTQRIHGEAIDAKFPDWQRVVNCDLGEPVAAAVGINFSYLESALKAAKIVGQDNKAMVMNTYASRIELSIPSFDYSTARAIIMQMKV